MKTPGKCGALDGDFQRERYPSESEINAAIGPCQTGRDIWNAPVSMFPPRDGSHSLLLSRSAGMPIVNNRNIEMTKPESVRHEAMASQPNHPSGNAPWTSKFPANVCRVFVESGGRDLAAILSATQRCDKEALLARLHSLKGALLVLGEQRVADHCVALEKLIEAHDIDAVAIHLEKLESDMSDLLQHYAEACEIRG
jgi:HPt (histidine-containing phosphotransfer) domain-containing protein